MTKLVTDSLLLDSFLNKSYRIFENQALNALRATAIEWLKMNGMPSSKVEKWRSFDKKPIERGFFALADPHSSNNHNQLLAKLSLEETKTSTIVVLNGVFQAQLSSIQLDGVMIESFSRLTKEKQNFFLERFSTHLDHCFSDDAFTKINLAGLEDFIVISVEEEHSLEAPIHVIYIIDDAHKSPIEVEELTHTSTMAFPHMLVFAGKYSNATLIEEWVTTAKTPFVNSVTEVILEDGANLSHIRLQRSGMDAFHVDRVLVEVQNYARYDACSYSFGALKSRTDVHIHLKAPEAWARIDGVAILDGKQESDTHSIIENAAPLVTSHQLHKLVVAGESHGIFNGCIWVKPGSQQIKSYQLNRNLLLSDKSRVDVKPQLEIFADDVECSHGSATGQLDNDQLFYLETRGIPPLQARATLTFAFAAEVIENIEVFSLKKRLIEETYARIQKEGSPR